MRVKVDYDLCEANAVCMDVAPELFKVDDDDAFHHVSAGAKDDVSGVIPKNLEGKAREAVRLCPRQALSILDK
jgi:ferredoxin